MDEAGRNRLWEKYIASHDSEIREQLIVEYAQLVKLVAGRMNMYLGYNVEYDDLVGYGVFGLIDAIDKFDSGKNVKFETYASLRIRGAILDQIRKMDWIPRSLRQKQNFDRYVAFLKKNDIPNIFMDGEDPQETAFDRKIKQTDLLEGIVPVSQCSLEEIAERNRDYYTNLDEKLDRLSKKLNFTSDLLQKERIKNQKIATEPLSKKVVNKVKGFLK